MTGALRALGTQRIVLSATVGRVLNGVREPQGQLQRVRLTSIMPSGYVPDAGRPNGASLFSS